MEYVLSKATWICWSKLNYECGQVENLEGTDISCMRCLIVSDFLHNPCDIKFNHKAGESLEEYIALLIRFNAATRDIGD